MHLSFKLINARQFDVVYNYEITISSDGQGFESELGVTFVYQPRIPYNFYGAVSKCRNSKLPKVQFTYKKFNEMYRHERSFFRYFSMQNEQTAES